MLGDLPAALAGSKAESTFSRYAGSWRRFREWCTARGVGHLPATPLTVALYLLQLQQSQLSYSSINIAACAIRAFHILAGLQTPTDDPVVASMRETAKRTGPPPGKNRK